MSPGCQKPAPGFVRVARTYPVMIPPSSVGSVAVTGIACGPTAMVEPLSVPVPGNIRVANTLVNASKTCFCCRSNLNSGSISF